MSLLILRKAVRSTLWNFTYRVISCKLAISCCDLWKRNFQDQETHSSTATNLSHLSLQFVAARETRIKTVGSWCVYVFRFIRWMAVISIVAIIIFLPVHELLVSVVKLGAKGFQIQEMGTGPLLRKIFNVKLVWSVSFLSKIAVKHQDEQGARTIHSSSPLIVPSKTSVPFKTSEI